MLRIIPHVLKSSILRFRSPIKVQAAFFARSPSFLKKYKQFEEQEREPCPQKEPPEPRPIKVNVYLVSTVAILVAAGGFIVYARNSPEIRDWVTIHAPWFDDIIAMANQDDKPYMESLMDIGSSCKMYLKRLLEDKTPEDCSLEGAPLSAPVPASAISSDDDDGEDDDEDDDEDGESCGTTAITSTDLCEIEKCMKELGDTILNNYITARDACLYYNKLVQETMANFFYKDMKKLKCEMDDRKDLVKTSLENIKSSQKQFSDLVRYVECGIQAPQERLEFTQRLTSEYKDNIQRVRVEFLIENMRSEARDAQWKMVKEFVDAYAEQNMAMYSGLNYMDQTPVLKGDYDFLLIQTKKYVDALQEQVNDAVATMSTRVTRGADTISMPQEQKDKLFAQANKEGTERMNKDFADRYTSLNAKFEREKQAALKEQKDIHEANLARRLKEKEVEVYKNLNKLIAEKVAAQKKVFDMQLEEMAIKVRLVEEKLGDKLKAEKESKRAQELYMAASSLLQATRKGAPVIKVEKELKAIKRAAGNHDKLVLTLLDAIPYEVWQKGIVPESTLRKRYHSMEDVARKVAMIESEGAPLPLYAFSWLQGMLLFMRMSSIPQVEIDNPPKEPFEDLDTFDLLQRARYFIESGNLAAAVRYVDSLQGASRGAAEAWHSKATAHMNVRQAAEAIIAHATAISLRCASKSRVLEKLSQWR